MGGICCLVSLGSSARVSCPLSRVGIEVSNSCCRMVCFSLQFSRFWLHVYWAVVKGVSVTQKYTSLCLSLVSGAEILI